MPSLNWIGKDKVLNHHNEVPYRMLDQKYTYGDGNTENMVIHGDNLEALKSLLPKYEGRVNCIYIDPPYNTGNEGWIYNDNVNDPKIKKWLGEVVGKEGDDLSRHDKWLCMMYPRLRLLHKLLSEDGVIFISIDDNELYSLKCICDEIFGNQNFVANICWQRNYSARNDSKGISREAEYIIVYSKKNGWQPNLLPRTEEMDSKYKNPDNDPLGLWRSDNAFAPNAITHQSMVYAIQNPFSGEMIYPRKTACWRYQQDTMLEIMSGWCSYELKNLHDEKERASVCGIETDQVRKDVLGIVLVESLEQSRQKALSVQNRGQWPKYYFTKNGSGSIAKKTYLDVSGGKPPTNLFLHKDVGHTDEAKKEIINIFGNSAAFDTPKPTRLLKRILQIATKDDSIVLDSFAGSGTTAHAVLNMNREDGGNRHFILVEMGDYADKITAERVKRVIDGYGDDNKRVEGTGGGFSYYELGEKLFTDNEYINPNVDTEIIREYIWYMETRTSCSKNIFKDNEHFLGIHNDTAYYFNYDKTKQTVLDNDYLTSIKTKADAYVIYADICNLSDMKMSKYNIIFKKIPRDIARL